MFKLQAKLRTPTLDFGAWQNALDKSAKETITEAAFTWVAVASALVPVWSGASRSTFQKLADEISFSLDVSPRGNVPDRRNEGKSKSEGDVIFDKAAGIYSFRYVTTLAHLGFNEEFNANVTPDRTLVGRLLDPGPYNFVNQANDAARPVLNDFAAPSLDRFIKSKAVR